MLVAARIIAAVQSIASLSVDPLKSVVVSIFALETDSNPNNVIPQIVRMKVTVHKMDALVQDEVEKRLGAVAAGVTQALGARADISYRCGYPVTVNADAETDYALAAAQSVSAQLDANTAHGGGEDFSYVLGAQRRLCFSGQWR